MVEWQEYLANQFAFSTIEQSSVQKREWLRG
jgi:hypothetical protein